MARAHARRETKESQMNTNSLILAGIAVVVLSVGTA
jgi:hypothetical protein